MDTSILEEIGLTKNEISVYISLLKLGTTTTGPLIKISGLHSSRVYESLNSLLSKGLASFMIRSNKKYYSASDPKTLLEMLDREKEDLSRLIPSLEVLRDNRSEKQSSVVYEGYKGVRSLYDIMIKDLKKGQEILVFGAGNADQSFMSDTYFLEYTKRRVSKGIKMKMIFDNDAHDTASYYKSLADTKVKVLPKTMKTPAAIDIYPKKINILVLKDTPIVFCISSEDVYQSYKEFFNIAWKMSTRI